MSVTFMVCIKTSAKSAEKCAIVFSQPSEIDKCENSLINNIYIAFVSNVTVYLLQCSSLADNLVSRLSLQKVLMTRKFKAVFYETGLTDLKQETVAQCLRKQSSKFEMKFILISKMKLLANVSSDLLFSGILQKEACIDFVQITGCDINILKLKAVLSGHSRSWNTINLSGCNINQLVILSIK